MAKEKIRVGILVYELSNRGGTKLALTLGEQLMKAGHEVAYSYVVGKVKEMERFFGGEYNFKLYSPSRPVKQHRLNHYAAIIRQREPTLRLLREFKPDVIIEMGGVMTSLLPVLGRVPTIHYSTIPISRYLDYGYLEKVNLLSKMQLSFFRFFENYIVSRISKLVIMCKFTENLVKKMWSKKYEMIYPPADINLFKPARKKKIILSVCRYDPLFQLEGVVDTFRKLKRKDYSLHLVSQLMKGEVSYYNKIKDYAKKDKNIVLHTNLSFKQLKKIYAESEIFLYSYWTHFGLIFVEAQASGLPIISMNKGGAKEIVVNGKSGFIVDNFDEMFEKLEELTKNRALLRKMAKASRQNAKRFSNETFRKKFVRAIEEVLRK